MNNILNQDLQKLETILEAAFSLGSSYLRKIDTLPTSVKPKQLPDFDLKHGVGGSKVLEEFQKSIEPLMVASTGPRYWGFVTGGATPAALIGDVLASIYDQNTQTTKGHGDVSGLVEQETIKMLLDFFNLPDDFLGGFVSGATMSNFTCLGVARQWIGELGDQDIAKNGVRSKINVLAAVPHSSSIKSLSMLGVGSRDIIKVNTINNTREAIDIADLEEKIAVLNGEPFILLSSGGTVNTVDFDDMQAIASLKKKHKFWWHVDAAFGGFAALSSSYSYLLKGWEHADSITIDAHKWLNVPYENAFFLVKESHKVLQVETFQNSNAPYLGDPMENFNFLNFLPENSRRFKALPVWFTLRAYGKDGYTEIVERNIELARQLGDFIEESNNFELLAPVRLNTVCFTLNNEQDADKVNSYLDRLNASGVVFMTPTTFNNRPGIRAALVNWRTNKEDILLVQKEMLKALNK